MAAYIKYDAIKKGESLAKGHEGSKGWVEVGSVQFGCGRGISSPVGTSSKREASAPNISARCDTDLSPGARIRPCRRVTGRAIRLSEAVFAVRQGSKGRPKFGAAPS